MTPTPATLSPSPARAEAGVRLVRSGPGLERVLDRNGRILGHVRRIEDGPVRYRAQRFHFPSGRFRSVGEFWSREEALWCLRNGG